MAARKQTDETRVEDVRHRRNDALATLVEHIPDIVARLDRNLCFQYISPTVEAITGTPPEAYIGRPRTNAGIPAAYASAREELSRKVFETGQESLLEFPIETPTGERLMECRLIPEFDGDGSVKSLITMTRDVTERKRAEQALLASENRLRLFIEHAPAAIAMFDREMRYLAVSRRWIEDHRLHQDVLGRLHYDVFPDSPDHWRDAHRRGLAGEVVRAEVERLDRRDGRTQYLRWETRPWNDVAGSIGGVLMFTEDVTAAVEAEQDLRQADRRKDEFLATLAHELRGPLAPLRYMLEVIKHNEHDVALVHQARDTMERQLGQLVRLVDDLLDVSRITRDKLELRKGPTELALVIAQAVEASRPLIESAKHELRVELPPEPVHLDADPARLTQVFSNLLNNAAKYTEPAGRISLSARTQGEEVEVCVKDSGIGIPAGQLASVFDMFMQGDRSLERSQCGLGIGLTLVRRLVELHGGSIEVRSEGEGQGSEFTVRLPILRNAPTTITASVHEPSPLFRRRRLLVVDDNRDSAATLAMLLRLQGNETNVAHDGPEALEAAERLLPEIVFLDIGLPTLNGYEVCRRIREQPWGSRMVLVALTGWSQAEHRRQSQEAGFDHHLVKPVDACALQMVLSEVGS